MVDEGPAAGHAVLLAVIAFFELSGRRIELIGCWYYISAKVGGQVGLGQDRKIYDGNVGRRARLDGEDHLLTLGFLANGREQSCPEPNALEILLRPARYNDISHARPWRRVPPWRRR